MRQRKGDLRPTSALLRRYPPQNQSKTIHITAPKSNHMVGATAAMGNKKLIIPDHVLSEYAALQAAAGKNEIGGIGIVEEVNENEIHLKKLFVATTSNSGSINKMSAEEVGSALFRAAEMGLFNRTYALFWHTHPGFGCFWSGTDVEAIEDQIIDGGQVINLLFSTPGEATARLDYIKDFKKFKAALAKEEKEAQEKNERDAVRKARKEAKKLGSLKDFGDIPSYSDIVKIVASLWEVEPDTFFARMKALKTQRKLMSIVRIQKTGGKLEIDVTTDPVRLSDLSTKPEIHSESIKVEGDFSYLAEELKIVKGTSSTNVGFYSPSRNATSTLGGGLGYDSQEYYRALGGGLGYDSLDGLYGTPPAKSTQPVEEKKTSAHKTKIVPMKYRSWEVWERAGEVTHSRNMYVPFMIPSNQCGAKLEAEVILPLRMSILGASHDLVEGFIRTTMKSYGKEHEHFELLVECHNKDVELGDWLFNNIEICCIDQALTIFYPIETPSEAIEILDEAVEAFVCYGTRRFSVVDVLDHICEEGAENNEMVDAYEALNQAASPYMLNDEILDFSLYQYPALREEMIEAIIAYESSEPDEGPFLNPTYGEVQKTIAAHGL